MSHTRHRILAVVAALVALASPVALTAAATESSGDAVAGICCYMR